MYKKITFLVAFIIFANSQIFANTIQINNHGIKQLALTGEAQSTLDARKEKKLERKNERAEKKEEIKSVKKKYHDEMKQEKQAHKTKMKELRQDMQNDIKSIKGQADSQAQ